MTVAAVIPTLKSARTLPRALESLRKQTVSADEVIVVDGVSYDGTREIALQAGARFLEREPRGQADARNFGIRQTQADLILPLDADDWIEPRFVELSLPHFENPNVGAVATGLIWPDGRVQWPVSPFTLEAFRTGNRMFCCSMFRRRAWEEIGGYDVGPTYEDWLLWMSMVARGWEIAAEWTPLFHYCPQTNGSSARMAPGAHQWYVEYLLSKYVEHLLRKEKCPASL